MRSAQDGRHRQVAGDPQRWQTWGEFRPVAAELVAAAAASSSSSSPREERVGRGPRRGETNKYAPPLPNPLLHPMEEREKSGSLMQPCWPAAVAEFHGY